MLWLISNIHAQLRACDTLRSSVSDKFLRLTVITYKTFDSFVRVNVYSLNFYRKFRAKYNIH